jgi:hypothetical protein
LIAVALALCGVTVLAISALLYVLKRSAAISDRCDKKEDQAEKLIKELADKASLMSEAETEFQATLAELDAEREAHQEAEQLAERMAERLREVSSRTNVGAGLAGDDVDGRLARLWAERQARRQAAKAASGGGSLQGLPH